MNEWLGMKVKDLPSWLETVKDYQEEVKNLMAKAGGLKKS